ncbi:MAG: protein kinase domain-containing protein, partial [Gemmataceae bacterium]
MTSKPNTIAEQNLIFAGLGLQLGILSKDKVIRAFTEWLFDKKVPLGQILLQQKAITQEQRNTLESAVKAHVQQEGDQEKALASLHMVKDLESDLDHLADKDLMGTLDVAITKRKNLGLDLLYSQSHAVDSKDNENFTFDDGTHSGKDRFERRQFLDSGNLGEVYFAKDLELNRLVVAKYIKPERSNESLTRALFHLEGEVTGSLEHPNIVPVYGLGKDTKGRLYYAMRYIRGRKLTRVIAEYHQIPKSESSKKHEALIGLLQYFQSACLAIEYAHSKGVLHCDIKPDNIMIGDYGEVFVVDWGLVVVSGEVKGSSDIQQMETLEPGSIPPYRPSELASSGLHEQQGGSRKSVGGTPAYMAPEQFKATLEEDVTHVTEKADIYALGSTLYHLLTNRAPHLPKGEGKESPDAFFFRITTGMIPKPKEIKSDVPNALQGIALKAMELNREDRYVSARELAEDIKRWVADEPVSAYQENLREKSSRFARNNKALLTAAAVALVFATVAGFGFGIVKQRYEIQANKDKEKAEANEKIAIEEKTKAIESAKIAKEQKQKAEAQQDRAESLLYVSKINRAITELENGSVEFGLEELVSTPFSYRGWEHDFIISNFYKNHVTLTSDSNGVFCYSPDGKKIASGSDDYSIK